MQLSVPPELNTLSEGLAHRRYELYLTVSGDGIGGAVSGGGSGLIGLKDRVEALSGRLRITSAAGDGTTLTATIPTGGD